MVPRVHNDRISGGKEEFKPFVKFEGLNDLVYRTPKENGSLSVQKLQIKFNKLMTGIQSNETYYETTINAEKIKYNKKLREYISISNIHPNTTDKYHIDQNFNTQELNLRELILHDYNTRDKHVANANNVNDKITLLNTLDAILIQLEAYLDKYLNRIIIEMGVIIDLLGYLNSITNVDVMNRYDGGGERIIERWYTIATINITALKFLKKDIEGWRERYHYKKMNIINLRNLFKDQKNEIMPSGTIVMTPIMNIAEKAVKLHAQEVDDTEDGIPTPNALNNAGSPTYGTAVAVPIYNPDTHTSDKENQVDTSPMPRALHNNDQKMTLLADADAKKIERYYSNWEKLGHPHGNFWTWFAPHDFVPDTRGECNKVGVGEGHMANTNPDVPHWARDGTWHEPGHVIGQDRE